MTENHDQKKSQEKELSALRKLTKRRWFYPALYLCAAALILTGVLLYQMNGVEKASREDQDRTVFNQDKPTAHDVKDSDEVFEWPANSNDTEEIQPFYDAKGTEEEQQAALVNYNHSYVQNTGINIGAKNDKTFTVTAAMSGKVTEAGKDDLLGYKVTLKHKNGVETMYQSLGSIDVTKGQEVVQGEKLGTAGTEALNKAMGVHLHFEIRKNGVPVSPENYMNKAAADVKAVTVGAQPATENPSHSGNSGDQDQSSSDNQSENNGLSDNSNNSSNANDASSTAPSSSESSQQDTSSGASTGDNQPNASYGD